MKHILVVYSFIFISYSSQSQNITLTPLLIAGTKYYQRRHKKINLYSLIATPPGVGLANGWIVMFITPQQYPITLIATSSV
jgi:hypothetical protein